MLSQVIQLIKKDITLEWRQKYAINGILIYVVSTIFLVYIAFINIPPSVWNVLFWIIMLFASVNAIAKSFVQEGPGRQLYYYTLVHPQAIILSKMLYNMLLMLVISAFSLTMYILFAGNPVVHIDIFLLAVGLGAIGFGLTFTMIAAIASKASGNATLMAILSFPVIIPMLLMLIRLSQNAFQPIMMDSSWNEVLVLLAIDGIIVTVALLLFPYLWRD